MSEVNYIDITGRVSTLPKFVKIGGVDRCEFLFKARHMYNHAGAWSYDYFEIPVIAFRKYAKKCKRAYERYKEIRITGSLSWNDVSKDRTYSGLHICADKVTVG